MSEVATAVEAHSIPSRHRVTGDVHLLLRRGNEVLLGLRQNTGFGDGVWHLPSGHLEAGESVVGAVIREAEEEIGVTIAPEDVRFAHVMHNASAGGRVAFFFTVRNWRGDPVNLEPDKCAELKWFSPEALPDPMIDYCRSALCELGGGRPFSVFGW